MKKTLTAFALGSMSLLLIPLASADTTSSSDVDATMELRTTSQDSMMNPRAVRARSTGDWMTFCKMWYTGTCSSNVNNWSTQDVTRMKQQFAAWQTQMKKQFDDKMSSYRGDGQSASSFMPDMSNNNEGRRNIMWDAWQACGGLDGRGRARCIRRELENSYMNQWMSSSSRSSSSSSMRSSSSSSLSSSSSSMSSSSSSSSLGL